MSGVVPPSSSSCVLVYNFPIVPYLRRFDHPPPISTPELVCNTHIIPHLRRLCCCSPANALRSSSQCLPLSHDLQCRYFNLCILCFSLMVLSHTPLSLYLFLSLSLYLFLCLYLYLSLSISPSLSLRYLSLSLSLSLSHSLIDSLKKGPPVSTPNRRI